MKNLLHILVATVALILFGCATSSTSTAPALVGAEGILTVEQGSLAGTTLHEGQKNAPVLSIRLSSKLSDIDVQRVKVDLGSNQTTFNRVFKTMYVVDESGKVYAQADLNANTVVKIGSGYYLHLGGFSYVVPKDGTRTLTVTADLYSVIKEADLNTRTISIPADGVRGVDKAGIGQYGPVAPFAQTVSVFGSLIDAARLAVSVDSANFPAMDVVAAQGPNNNELDRLPVLAFDVRASNDSSVITDIPVTIVRQKEGGAVVTSAYLYSGSTLIGSASVNGGNGFARFSQIDYRVQKDSTAVFTVKADIRNASGTSSEFAAVVNPVGIVAHNSEGSQVFVTGSATGNSVNVRNVGPVLTLIGPPTASVTSTVDGSPTVSATFNVLIQAVGGDVYLGSQAASSTFTFAIFRNGVASGKLSVPYMVSWMQPSAGVVTTGLVKAALKIPQNGSVTIPVYCTFEGRTATGSAIESGQYAVGLETVKWSTRDGDFATSGYSLIVSSFMAGQPAWRSASVRIP